MHTVHYRIILFIIFSMTLHGLLLLTLKEVLQFDFGGQHKSQPAIQLTFGAAPKEQSTKPPSPSEPEPEPIKAIPANKQPTTKKVAASVTKKIAPSKQARPKVTPEEKQPIKKVLPIEKRQAPAAVPKAETKEKRDDPPVSKQPPQPKTLPTQAASSSAQSRAMIRRLIQSELVRYFQYPRLARRRGWEGQVLLEFTVSPNGNLSNIRIKDGSRFGVLNRSAVETMSKIGQLNKITPGAISTPIRMEIPIIYQLSDR